MRDNDTTTGSMVTNVMAMMVFTHEDNSASATSSCTHSDERSRIKKKIVSLSNEPFFCNSQPVTLESSSPFLQHRPKSWNLQY